jgi:hypothetical protein
LRGTALCAEIAAGKSGEVAAVVDALVIK